MSDDGDNIERLKVRFKKPGPVERTLFRPHEVGRRTCSHENFVVDVTKETVECKDCAERLNPMWVLGRLASRDHRFYDAHLRYAEETKRLAERSRTKCDRCGHMTRISRR